jgi:hypothetical protein
MNPISEFIREAEMETLAGLPQSSEHSVYSQSFGAALARNFAMRSCFSLPAFAVASCARPFRKQIDADA